jgi:hypothetical protein
MTRLLFENAAPVAPASPNRMDVACFVGYVRRRVDDDRAPEWRRAASADAELRGELADWMGERGWTKGPYRRASAEQLRDVPVPIDSWDQFAQLFDWSWRPASAAGGIATTYIGAAVRSFFAQGGRRCYVVSAGDPWRVDEPRVARMKRLDELIPGFSNSLQASTPANRGSWHGVGHVLGLPEVALLCVPDLPDIVGLDPLPPREPDPVPITEEQFVECTPGEDDGGDAMADTIAARSFAPRANEQAYRDWASAINRIAALLRNSARETQLVAGLPIPVEGSPADVALLESGLASFLDKKEALKGTYLASSFVQLAFPWVRTPGSSNLPERLENPDGVLAGVLARNAIVRGAYRCAAGLHLGDVFDVFPTLSRRDLNIRFPARDERRSDPTLVERVSLLGRVPRGLTVLSDVTPSNDETYRPASVHRLITVIARAARHLGEAVTFEGSNEELWLRVRSEMERLLGGLYEDGALRGATADDAFEVRCDRSTMTQNDIDNGRVIATVQITAAAPIEVIRITLAMEDSGVVTLTPSVPREAAA